jgi:uncharacterized protein GlcG (DUF336 family)
MSFRLAAAMGAIIAVPSFASAQVPTERSVSVRMALIVAEAALAECGTTVSVAVVDRTGRLRVFLHGDDAAPNNIELARRKAYTAETFGKTSLEWAQRTESNVPGQRALWSTIRLFYSLIFGGVPLQGGVPIKIGHDVIGGVGVSGAPTGDAREEACAQAGIAEITDRLK